MTAVTNPRKVAPDSVAAQLIAQARAEGVSLVGPGSPLATLTNGLGAARFHHAIARAIGVVVVAVPEQHRPVALVGGGRVVFTRTAVTRLEARFEHTGLGGFLVTTPEQTLVDRLDRPQLGGIPAEAVAAAGALTDGVDRARVRGLAAQRSRTVQAKVDALLGEGPGAGR